MDGQGLGARGEAVLEVRGTVYPVLYTNRALAVAEREVGRPVLKLLKDLIADEMESLTFDEAARLLQIGLEAGRRDAQVARRPYTLDDAWAVMDAVGFLAVARTVLVAMGAVVKFGAGDAGGEEHPPA